MATSRTGTSRYKKTAARFLHQAQQTGITHCPNCRTQLDYENRRRPNGATIDHIIPHSHGGADHQNNYAILCFRCNVSKGNMASRTKHTTRAKQHITPHTPTTDGRKPGRPH